MNGMLIFSFISPAIGSWSITMTGRDSCKLDGGGRMAITTPVPRQSGRGAGALRLRGGAGHGEEHHAGERRQRNAPMADRPFIGTSGYV